MTSSSLQPSVWSRLPTDMLRCILDFLSSADRTLDLTHELRLLPHPLEVERRQRLLERFSLSTRTYLRTTFIAHPSSDGWDRWSYQLYWRWIGENRCYRVWVRTSNVGTDWGPWEHSRYRFVYPMYYIHKQLSRYGRLRSKEEIRTRVVDISSAGITEQY